MRKTWTFLVPGIGAAVLAISPSLMAQDRSADPVLPEAKQQLQMMIDPATGMKIGPDDSAATNRVLVVNAAEFAKRLPKTDVQAVRQKNGTITAAVPEELMMNLVMVIDENGKRTVRHQTSLTEVEADHGETH